MSFYIWNIDYLDLVNIWYLNMNYWNYFTKSWLYLCHQIKKKVPIILLLNPFEVEFQLLNIYFSCLSFLRKYNNFIFQLSIL